MERLKVFISYAEEDKHFAGQLKSYFENYVGFDVYIAHDNLQISNDWLQQILNNLAKADIFVPLISKYFLQSYFANQELGFALGRRKEIAPISVDGTKPEGLIRNRQAHVCGVWTKDEFIEVTTNIFLLAIKDPRLQKYKHKAMDSLCHALASSDQFGKTGAIITIMRRTHTLYTFNDEQIEFIIQASEKNYHIFGSRYWFSRVKEFLQKTYGKVLTQPEI